MIKWLAYFVAVLMLSITSPSNHSPHPVRPLAGRFGAMADQLDPHHLVALMCYEFRGKQDGSDRRLNPPSDLTSGIVNHHGTNVRTRPVMDALAHISVSQPDFQVVAIALQLKHGTKEIRLTIAENQDVGDTLVNHLYNIWGKLQALSDEYAGQRAEGQRAEAWDENRGTEELDGDPIPSPPIPLGVGQPLKLEIFREVYQYCLKKHMKRVKKWYGGLSDFTKELDKHHTSVDLRGLEQNLSEAVIALVLALELVFKLFRRDLTNDEWEEVYWQSMLANKSAELVLADRHGLGCEKLARELKGMPPLLPISFTVLTFNLTSLLYQATILETHSSFNALLRN